MCCFFLSLVFFGPRLVNIFWWLFQPARWNLAFAGWPIIWWIWPALGIVFLPWTTLMYIIVSPGGIIGFDWLWLAIMFFLDIVSYGGGIGRKRIPGYEGY